MNEAKKLYRSKALSLLRRYRALRLRKLEAIEAAEVMLEVDELITPKGELPCQSDSNKTQTEPSELPHQVV